MALTANSIVPELFPGHDGLMSHGLVYKNQHIFEGSMLGKTPSGFIKTFEAGDEWVGWAKHEYYNSSATDGEPSVAGNVATILGKEHITFLRGGIVAVPLTGLTQADRGKPVFALSDNSYSLIGHPDAFIGYIWEIERGSTTKAWVRVREGGEQVRQTDGVHFWRLTGDETIPNVITASNETAVHGFRLDAIGAGITAGAGWKNVVNVAGGEIVGTLDNDNEAQNLTIETPLLMAQTYGMTIRCKGRLSVLGPTATTDFTLGLMTAATSTMTDAIRANTEVTTSGIGKAAIHNDGDSVNLLFTVDDNATVVGPTDTTLDNSLTVNKDTVIIIRPSGVVELWVDGVRIFGTTTLTVGASITTLWGGIVNLEKSTGTDVSAVNIQLLEVKGASLPA